MATKRKKRKANIPNLLLTLFAIIFLLVLVFKFHYNVSSEMITSNNTGNQITRSWRARSIHFSKARH